MAYQTFSEVLELSVAENLYLRRRSACARRTGDGRLGARTLAEYDLHRPVDAARASLPLAERQMLEVVKALQSEPKVLVIDEPTTSLGPRRSSGCTRSSLDLAARGVGVIYVSHRLLEVLSVVQPRDGAARRRRPGHLRRRRTCPRSASSR